MMKLNILLISSLCVLGACSNPQPGPDKGVGGATLGAGWGAGAGAIIGHQVSYTGEGAAIGAGLGLVGGALSGLGYDLNDSALIREQQELDALKVQNMANRKELGKLQDKFDRAITSSEVTGAVYQVFFDTDAVELKAGASANLEVISEALKSSPQANAVHVVGHSDDSGTPDYNQRLGEARARNVAAYLMSRGNSGDQIKMVSYGSERPIASNSTPIGRQLNRRVDVYISRG